MRRLGHSATAGLEGAPDIMLLTMAALMVAIVWLSKHAIEHTLPPIDLPHAEGARLGDGLGDPIVVTLRPAGERSDIYLGEARLEGGLAALRETLAASTAREMVLRADGGTRWEDALRVMDAAARQGLVLSVAGDNR